MCQFLSALVLKNGDVVCDPEYSDSHEDLVAAHELRDNGDNFIRVEFAPPSHEAMFQPDKYEFKVDQPSRPEWFTLEMEARTVETLRDRIQRMILDGTERTLLLGGCWMIRNSKIGGIKGGRVVIVSGTSAIRGVRGSATISDVGDSATIRGVRDSATISGVRDSATISDVGGSATIRGVRDSATIRGVWGSATISDVGDSAKILDDHRTKKDQQ